MGLVNVIKLANDYNKAKKAIESKKIDAIKIKRYLDSLHDIVDIVKSAKKKLDEFISHVKEIMEKLSELLKNKKG